ncbi:Alpha/Beta hydrolase protein [Aspergillus leporis]|jgi:pimeloyl-ACP methyl ester carboxylesterase|uniref:Alpha/Beta hydrolase protein n=1 Tax=Aspergillus leporis TaxID=41062 RepID=A0A5N5WG90_9EURO|nr:Alpha/Beta hydrolase protein [Aspergillus leporis]
MSSSQTEIKRITLPQSKITIFYQEQGNESAPVILLLLGFPSSSHQYRNLIPLLATKYRVIAPDLPGFGFTEVASSLSSKYTFANLASTIAEFLDVLAISRFSVYVFDYGAPTAFRLCLQRAQAIRAIISQNGNAYEDGLGAFWDPVRTFWASGNTPENRAKLEQAMLTYAATKWQYEEGTRGPTAIAPVSNHLDYALLQRPGNADIQVDLFKDYENNVKLHPAFKEHFQKPQVPLLAIWGRNDQIFIPPGAEAFKRDLPNAEVQLIDAGHFAVESDTQLISQEILGFLERQSI